MELFNKQFTHIFFNRAWLICVSIQKVPSLFILQPIHSVVSTLGLGCFTGIILGSKIIPNIPFYEKGKHGLLEKIANYNPKASKVSLQMGSCSSSCKIS